MYTHINTLIHTCTHIHMHTHTHAHAHTCIHTHACTHIRIHTHMHAHTHAYTHIHTRTHTHTHTHIQAHTHTESLLIGYNKHLGGPGSHYPWLYHWLHIYVASITVEWILAYIMTLACSNTMCSYYWLIYMIAVQYDNVLHHIKLLLLTYTSGQV